MPVLGVHSWRQADRLPWRHFAEQGDAYLASTNRLGRCKRRLCGVGIPIYPFLVSRLYGLIGIQEWLGRGLSVLCSALTIWLVIRISRRWFNPDAGWWAGMALQSHPGGVLRKTFQAEALLVLCAAER